MAVSGWTLANWFIPTPPLPSLLDMALKVVNTETRAAQVIVRPPGVAHLHVVNIKAVLSLVWTFWYHSRVCTQLHGRDFSCVGEGCVNSGYLGSPIWFRFWVCTIEAIGLLKLTLVPYLSK